MVRTHIQNKDVIISVDYLGNNVGKSQLNYAVNNGVITITDQDGNQMEIDTTVAPRSIVETIQLLDYGTSFSSSTSNSFWVVPDEYDRMKLQEISVTVGTEATGATSKVTPKLAGVNLTTINVPAATITVTESYGITLNAGEVMLFSLDKTGAVTLAKGAIAQLIISD